MIKAQFLNKSSTLCGFMVSGHAGFADKGEDIVCASVSSAVQMTCNTITEIFHTDAAVTDIKGTIKLLVNDACDENIKAVENVLKGLRLHLTILSKQFPGTIRIEDSEV